MKVNFSPFLTLGSTVYEKVLKVFAFICWVGGGAIYVYFTYEAFHWALIFPTPNAMNTAAWLTHISNRLLALWLPMAIPLVHWRIMNMISLLLYLGGGVLAIMFNVISLILITGYTKEGALRKEYESVISPKNNEPGFPSALLNAIKFHKCCGWYGPTDFFENIKAFGWELKKPFAKKRTAFVTRKLKDAAFKDGVSKCYGNAIIFGSGSGSPSAGSGKIEKIVGCFEIYETLCERMMNYIASSAIITILLGGICIALFALCFVKLRQKSSVAPAPYPPAQVAGTGSDESFMNDPNMATAKSETQIGAIN